MSRDDGDTSTSGAPPTPPDRQDLEDDRGLPFAPRGRYELLRLLGIGGMGEVWLAMDHLLGREVALKQLNARAWGSSIDERRFVEEARLQARLQHPDIVPLYDLGRLPEDPRPFFTMRVVRGRNLRDAAVTPAAGIPELRRRVEILRRVAEAMAFAHQEGLIHRDLKPSNIMLGDNGEVTVVDWGIGLALKASVEGDMAGTLPYMAPEAQIGAKVDLRADIYGLGATLLHALSGRPPIPRREIGPQIPSGTPEDLRALLLHATHPEHDRRLPSAQRFAQGLRDWLEGAHEQERALALVAEAEELRRSARERKLAAARLDDARGALAGALPPWAGLEEKRRLWALEDAVADLRDKVTLDEARLIETLGAALRRAPELPEAHDALADAWRERHAEAEAQGATRAAAQAELVLRAHDSGRHAAWLSGEGRLTLWTDPPGATVRLHRYREQDRRLIPVFEREVGPTPITDLPLERGSWLCTLHAPGRAAVRYPIAIGRCEAWDGVPPGGSQPRPIHLPLESELGTDELYVPAGYSWVGGDARAPRSLPRARVWVEPFILRRFQVTNAEYLAFLDDLLAQGREAEAEELAPRYPDAGGEQRGASLYARGASGAYQIIPDGDGYLWPVDAPVVYVDCQRALACCRWRSARDGLPWRLPGHLEWERAARGADGRAFPWGDRLDPTQANMAQSRQRPLPAPVGEFPCDESPFGVRDMAGNVVELGGDVEVAGVVQVGRIPEGGDYLHISKGGGYLSPEFICRAAARMLTDPAFRSPAFGFRLARGLVGQSGRDDGAHQY